jgi:uncharacterized protein
MAPGEGDALVRVFVAYSPGPEVVDEVQVSLTPGATVADALQASGLQARHAGVDLSTAPVGLWGALCERTQVLREHDRVEVYRPLKVDPKEARRLRYKNQRGTRSAKLSR